jgi:SNF2 family DNA or RNA helicase
MTAWRTKSELYPYQQDLITFLYEKDEAIAIVRPGGGKTVSALTAMAELMRDGATRHALVIAPKRVARSVWPDEIAQWEQLKSLSYTVLAGSPAERKKYFKSRPDVDITIVGIDIVPWLFKQLENLPDDHPLFDLLVIDEISKLRDPTGTRAKKIAAMAHRWRMIWGLTGTLRPSGPLDCFMPVRIVTRGKLWGESFYKWQKANFYPTDYQRYEWAPFPGGTEQRLNDELAPLVCIPELPSQSQPTIVFDRIELPPDARARYREMEKRLFASLTDKNKIIAASAAVATGKLAQISNGFIYDDATVAQPIHDEKREWLLDVIDSATGPMILIYEFRRDLEIMCELLGDKLEVLDETDGANNVIDRWNRGEVPFLAMHPASGGHGLNLQFGGSDMCWMSPTWSPEMWEQTIARLNRPGQKQQVIVRVCVADETVDDMKLDRVHFKMDAQSAFERYLQNYNRAA